MQEYKNLTWVWGADRKFCPEGHCLASRGSAEWCKTVIPRDGIFYLHRTIMFDSFSCLPFDFLMFYFKSIIHYHTQWRWHKTFLNLTSLWRRNDINLMTKLCDILYNQRKLNSCENFFFYPTHEWDNMGEIRISIPSEDLKFAIIPWSWLGINVWHHE